MKFVTFLVDRLLIFIKNLVFTVFVEHELLDFLTTGVLVENFCDDAVDSVFIAGGFADWTDPTRVGRLAGHYNVVS